MLYIDDAIKRTLKAEEIAVLEQRGAELDDLFRTYGRNAFTPCAYYDAELDCVRVIVRDCSTCEYRISELLTVLHDTDLKSDPAPIGFTLKGIRKFVGSTDTVVKLTELLDQLVKNNPDEGVLAMVNMLKKVTHRAGLEDVQLKEAA